MLIESFPLSRTTQVEKAKEPKSLLRNNEENPKDKPERDERKDLNQVVDKLNKTSELFGRHLKFKVHDESKRTVIQVVNDETGEVLREIPPEKALDMMQSLEKAIGLIIDKKV